MTSLHRFRPLSKLLSGLHLQIRKTLKRHSALFISGAKRTDTFAYVTPHLDWAEKVVCEETLRKDLQRRQIHFDVDELKSIWQFYNEMVANKNELETKKIEISKKITELMKSSGDPQDVEKLKIHSNLIRENLKSLKVSLWSIEENAFVRALQLPNFLDDRTPSVEDTIVHIHLDKPDTGSNHLDSHELIHFDSNGSYFLKGDAAIFELGATFYFGSVLREHNFVQFSNPDFAKSLVLEGCGAVPTDPCASFILSHDNDSILNPESRVHLVGGASLQSFFAYHTKNVLDTHSLPLKYFAIGRKYLPPKHIGHGLFGVNQSTALEIFTIAATRDQTDQILDELLELCKKLYSELGHHFRLSHVSAHRLLQWESSRVSVEMFSFSLGTYVEVGNVSVSGDYVSKRLMLTCKARGSKLSGFPSVMSGELLMVPRLLACTLEQGTTFHLPQHFHPQNWLER